ncbi:hypothetical protein BAMTA208_07770 [Bacillus amyloliquefaciens TA208]|nr:hypothetical protein BAMTA208_07770 [Bacillus amyloliquefaciens TA208]
MVLKNKNNALKTKSEHPFFENNRKKIQKKTQYEIVS